MFTVKPYTPEQKSQWDEFLDSSNVHSFLMKRDYMDYHADRFRDHSLLIYKKDKLFALQPATLHEEGQELISHGGLTYGGLICASHTTQIDVIECFQSMLTYLREKTDVKKWVYKQTPNIYTDIANQGDLYALHALGGTLIRKDVSTIIDLDHPYKYSTQNKRNIKKAKQCGLAVQEQNSSFKKFYTVLEEALAHHNSSPVHTLAEIKKLKDFFPNHIRIFECHDESGSVLAIVLVFVCKKTVHTQYLAASDKGKQVGALTFLLDYLVKDQFANMRYFSFGTSHDTGEHNLNHGLIRQKEGFGGMTQTQDFYSIFIQ